MGIYISGMEIPTSCAECVFKSVTGVDRWKCHALNAEFMSWSVGWGGKETRRINCPLVPVPEFSDIGFDSDDAWKKIFTLVVLLLSDREKFDKLKDDMLADLEGTE